MKITKILNNTDTKTDWEEWSYSTLRDASRSNIHVETIHLSGSEIILEGIHHNHSSIESL